MCRSRHPDAVVTVGPHLDLSSQDSVRNFATEYQKQGWPLHVLINNAGAIYEGEPWYTPSGVGGLCQINYLGPFTLTRLLEPLLLKSAPSRVVHVSSVTHRFSCIGNPSTFLTNWQQGSRYGATKLANAVFAFELERRLEGSTTGVHSVAVDPGAVGSSIWQGEAVFRNPPLSWIIDSLYAPNSDGAAAVVHAATVPWEQEAPLSANINAKWNSATTEKDSEENSKEDLRFYARGLFTSPLVTSLRGVVSPTPERGFPEKIRDAIFGVSALFHSGADWPLRRFSGGRWAAESRPVPAAPLAYDRELAKKLWEVSCDAANVPYTTINVAELNKSVQNAASIKALKE